MMKKIPDGKYRVIKISREALTELIYESITERQEEYFDVSDGTSIVKLCDMDWDRGELICIARSELDEDEEHFQFPGIDTAVLMDKLKDTTDTMFSDGRFIELSEAEIKEIQDGADTPYAK